MNSEIIVFFLIWSLRTLQLNSNQPKIFQIPYNFTLSLFELDPRILALFTKWFLVSDFNLKFCFKLSLYSAHLVNIPQSDYSSFITQSLSLCVLKISLNFKFLFFFQIKKKNIQIIFGNPKLSYDNFPPLYNTYGIAF